jgi:hypothetical protein
MRHGLCAAAVVLMVAAQASAQGKKDKKDPKAEEKKPGAGMMEETGADPAAGETLDEGPFAPSGKTGKLKEEKESVEEKAAVQKRRAKKPFLIFGEVLIGFGKAPFEGIGPDGPATTGKGTVYGLTLGGGYDFSSSFTAGLRAAASNGVEEQLGGANKGENQATFALGAPELFAEYRVEAGALTRIPLRFGVGIPVAMGQPDPTSQETDKQAQYRVQLLADAASGWRDGELYQPGRLPITLRGGVDHERTRFSVYAYEKLVLLPKVKGEITDPDGIPGGTYELSSFAVRSVTAAGMTYDIVADKAFLGLDLWGAWDLVEPLSFTSASGAEGRGTFQFALEPRAGGRFGIATPSLGFIVPIGGPLENEMHAFRLHCDISF